MYWIDWMKLNVCFEKILSSHAEIVFLFRETHLLNWFYIKCWTKIRKKWIEYDECIVFSSKKCVSIRWLMSSALGDSPDTKTLWHWTISFWSKYVCYKKFIFLEISCKQIVYLGASSLPLLRICNKKLQMIHECDCHNDT